MQFQEKSQDCLKSSGLDNEDDGDRGWDGRGNNGMTSHKLNYSTRNNNRRQCPVIDYYCIYSGHKPIVKIFVVVLVKSKEK